MLSLFRRRDTRSRINSVSSRLTSAFAAFKRAHEAVEKAQSELEKTINESNLKAEKLKAKLDLELTNQQDAKAAMEYNETLKARLKDFII